MRCPSRPRLPRRPAANRRALLHQLGLAGVHATGRRASRQARPRRARRGGLGGLMDTPANSLIETRGAQMFPTLSPAEVQRLRRFGAVRTYEKGDALVRVGESGHGLTVFLAGEA